MGPFSGFGYASPIPAQAVEAKAGEEKEAARARAGLAPGDSSVETQQAKQSGNPRGLRGLDNRKASTLPPNPEP